MREERLADERPVFGDRRLRREPLVGRHVLDEAEQLWRKRSLRKRRGTPAIDARREFHDVIVRQPGKRPDVPYVDDVDRAVAVGERGQQPERRVAVKRAAAPLEQRRLLGQQRVAVQVEQVVLDGRDGRGPRLGAELLGEDVVVRVEVAQVVGRDCAQLLEEPSRHMGLSRQLVSVLGDQLRKHVVAVEADGADPRQVVEPDLVDEQALGLHPEHPGERALEADRNGAEADRPVPCVQKRARDDPDRVREVEDPCVGSSLLANALGDLEHDRNRPKRLRQASCAGRLLSDAAAGKWHRFVAEPRFLPANADLDDHEVGSFQSGVEVAGYEQLTAEPLPLEHPSRHAAEDVQPFGVDVVQGEPLDIEPVEPRHELRGVGRAGPDDREPHPFTPVSVTPSTKARCARKNRTITGAMKSSVAAIVRFHCTW
jgi:hypothetical protein